MAKIFAQTHAADQTCPDQEGDHDRDCEFMHLDYLINWIINDRLVNELRAVLDERLIQSVIADPS